MLGAKSPRSVCHLANKTNFLRLDFELFLLLSTFAQRPMPFGMGLCFLRIGVFRTIQRYSGRVWGAGSHFSPKRCKVSGANNSSTVNLVLVNPCSLE